MAESTIIYADLRNIVESIFGQLVLEVVFVGDGIAELGVLLGHLQDPVPPVVGALYVCTISSISTFAPNFFLGNLSITCLTGMAFSFTC
jgi:hypothetical protein